MFFLLIPKAYAHATGAMHEPWWNHWNDSWIIISSLLLCSFLYGLGWKRMKTRFKNQNKVLTWQRIAFAGAIFSLVLALLSPIDGLSDYLAWVHMIQHSLLMMVAAPLLALSSPSYMAQWSVPSIVWQKIYRIRKRISSLLARPLWIWFLYSFTLWLWHVPFLYEEALKTQWIHDLQHLSFFMTSYFFWRILLDPFAKGALAPGTGLIYIFVASIHAMILGVLMTLSPIVWYKPYELTAPHYGLSALEDQQLAGLIMWMPAGLTYLLMALWLFARILGHNEGPRSDRPATFVMASKGNLDFPRHYET